MCKHNTLVSSWIVTEIWKSGKKNHIHQLIIITVHIADINVSLLRSMIYANSNGIRDLHDAQAAPFLSSYIYGSFPTTSSDFKLHQELPRSQKQVIKTQQERPARYLLGSELPLYNTLCTHEAHQWQFVAFEMSCLPKWLRIPTP